MKLKEKALMTVSFLIIVFLFIYSNSREPSEPKEFVKNKTFTNFSNVFFSYEITRYPSNVEIMPIKQVNNTLIGLVTDPWNINFGIIPGNGTYVKRNIELTNLKERESKIVLKTYGNISPLVSFSKNDFIIKPNEKVSIDIFLFSNETEPGNYSGEIDVIAKKPIYNFLPIS